MPIISLEIMKIGAKKHKQTVDASFSERVRTKRFHCAFKIGFLQLICKASLIFKSN